jgi:hypothetical protein
LLRDARQAPSLLADALQQGRVLVDRDGQWPILQASATTWRRRAKAAEVPLEEALADLDAI